MKHNHLCLIGCALLPLLSGCETAERYSLTYRLWDEGNLSHFSVPAPDPQLALFESTVPADVVVEYDALSEKTALIKRRAYFLYRNQDRVSAGKQPEWIQPPLPGGLKPIPILVGLPDAANAFPCMEPCAVPIRDGQGFTLFDTDGKGESFELPSYAESHSGALRVVLTPLAIAGDTLMVGGVASIVAFLVWVQLGAPTG
jgi:hypothetical protein